MTTACSTIVSRAQSFSPLNSALTTDRGEMLSRIRADQQMLFTSMAGLARGRFQASESLTSTNAASGRTFDLSTLTSPLERLLKVVLQDGREVNQVDILDTDAELSPRYTIQGLSLIEVGSDWSSVSGTVSATFTYLTGATDIDPTGDLSQNVSVPDAWIDLLVLPLAFYLFQKDPGRDPNEGQRIQAMLDERQQAWMAYLTQYGGIETQRFLLPTPKQTGKR